MDSLLRERGLISLPMLMLSYREIPLAFMILSLEYLAPKKQAFWCIDESGIRLHNGSDQCHYPSAEGESGCRAWHYDAPRTFTSEFDAVCDRKNLRVWAQSALMAGTMLGNLIFSHFSDWFGRRTVIFFSNLIILCGGIACTLASSFTEWIVLRVIVALELGGNMNGPYTLGMESTGLRYRALLAAGDCFGWIIGMMTLPIFPYFIQDWRQLQIAISLTTLPMLIMVWFVHESPRWLIATHRFEEAEMVIREILSRQSTQKSDEEAKEIIRECFEEHRETSKQPKASLVDLVKAPMRCLTTLSFCVQYPLYILAYYNLLEMILRVDNGGIFANLLWAGVFELPVALLVYLLVAKFRRRTLYFITNLPPFFCCLILFLYAEAGFMTTLTLAALAKMGAQVGFAVLGVHVNEIYPTRVRGIALGTGITLSRVGAIISPFAMNQGWINENLLSAAAFVIALSLAMPLKETYGESLPEDFEDNLEAGRVRRRSGPV
ncbi:solute carrier family 22 member 5-like [Galendromus occidentalis]|uniref:Solute carrier family 22 member 5-like n=1 Tax=Galendromus occidentalis TaxID=34638 RepID=A0AAJ6QVJ0_9ACAR|nr:solute carrier family 22 member 5-like [Galendromus occidentalis]